MVGSSISRGSNMFNASVIEQVFKAPTLETVKQFVEKDGIPASITNVKKQTLAHVAAANGQLDILQFVLEKDPYIIEERDQDNYSVLDAAIISNVLSTVKFLVKKYEASNHEWSQAVRTAIEFNRFDILKYFFDEKNCDVNSPEQQPPVFLAVHCQHGDIIQYLVEEKKANLTMIDYNKENILYEAVRKDDLAFMKLVLDKKGIDLDVNWRNWDGETLVHAACSFNRTKILRYLVEKKNADIKILTKREKMTPLHIAASHNYFQICKFLLEHGANVDVADNYGSKPTQYASDKELLEYMRTFSGRRNRRSAFFPPSEVPSVPVTYYTCKLWKKINGRSSEQVVAGRSEVTDNHSFDALFRFPFHNFFVAAAFINVFSYVSKFKRTSFRSPSAMVVEDKIDPLAVESVDGFLNFK